MELYVQSKGAVRLEQSDFVAQGGEGRVYARGNTAYKVYNDPSRMIPVAKIRELSVLTDVEITRPEDVLLDAGNTPVGYTMRRVQDAHPLCRLFTRSFRERKGVSNRQILALARTFQETVQHIHNHHILIVDLNEMNFLLDRDLQRILCIDVDSYKTPGFPATAIMDSIRDRHSAGYSVETDWFSFAVITFQMFIGVHPYRGKHPTLTDLDARMRANVSVLNRSVAMPPTAYALDLLPAAYRDWYQAVFEQGLRTPPPTGATYVASVKPRLLQMPAAMSLKIREIARFAACSAAQSGGYHLQSGGYGAPAVNTAASPAGVPDPIPARPGTPGGAGFRLGGLLGALFGGVPAGANQAPGPAVASAANGGANGIYGGAGYGASSTIGRAGSAGASARTGSMTATILQVIDPMTALTTTGLFVRSAQKLSWVSFRPDRLDGSGNPTCPDPSVSRDAANPNAGSADNPLCPPQDRLLTVTPRLNRLVLAWREDGLLRLWDVAAGKSIPCALKADGLVLSDGRVYLKQCGSLFELRWLEMPAALQPMLHPVANVMPSATHLFEGVAVQDLLGACHASIFPSPGVCHTIRIRELDGRRILDAKYEHNVLMIASEKSGAIEISIVRFGDGYADYDLRLVPDAGATDVGFVALDNGICLWLNPQQELEIFSNRKGASAIKVLNEPALHGARLFKLGTQALFARGDTLYEMTMGA